MSIHLLLICYYFKLLLVKSSGFLHFFSEHRSYKMTADLKHTNQEHFDPERSLTTEDSCPHCHVWYILMTQAPSYYVSWQLMHRSNMMFMVYKEYQGSVIMQQSWSQSLMRLWFPTLTATYLLHLSLPPPSLSPSLSLTLFLSISLSQIQNQTFQLSLLWFHQKIPQQWQAVR